jgi:methylmalonyl-CoA carboxyltransferase 12S subunit
MTARERIDALLDKGTFLETGMFALHQSSYFGLDKAELPADGVVTGEGAVFGRPGARRLAGLHGRRGQRR